MVLFSFKCKRGKQANKKAEAFSSAYSSMLVDFFAQPNRPTFMLEG
jgi:hypothetical protein